MASEGGAQTDGFRFKFLLPLAPCQCFGPVNSRNGVVKPARFGISGREGQKHGRALLSGQVAGPGGHLHGLRSVAQLGPGIGGGDPGAVLQGLREIRLLPQCLCVMVHGFANAAQMLQGEDIAQCVVTIARLHPRAVVRELVITPLYQEYA